jgi:hypothetical protein
MNETVLKRRIKSDQQTHEEMFNILSHKGNANQNYIEIPFYPCQNGYHQENKKQCWDGSTLLQYHLLRRSRSEVMWVEDSLGKKLVRQPSKPPAFLKYKTLI